MLRIFFAGLSIRDSSRYYMSVPNLLQKLMTTSARFLVSLFYIFYYAGPSFGQGHKTVLWQFEAGPSANSEVVLKFTAHVAPGWHLYSQQISENGPMPTRFSFEHGDDYIVIGQIEEKGEATNFHDDTYEMEITWYSGTV